LLLVSIWVLSVFDLVFTLVARAMEDLIELNPIASWVMTQHGDLAVIAYKFSLMTLGTVILWVYRKRRRAEHAAWMMLLVHVLLSFRWHTYYHRDFAFDFVVVPPAPCLPHPDVAGGSLDPLLSDEQTDASGHPPRDVAEAEPVSVSSQSIAPTTPAAPGPRCQTRMADARSEAGGVGRR